MACYNKLLYVFCYITCQNVKNSFNLYELIFINNNLLYVISFGFTTNNI